MAELADALDSGSSEGNFMQVQVLLPAPSSENPYFKRFSGVFLSVTKLTPCFAGEIKIAYSEK